MALVQVQVPYREGYDYGIGVDLASGSPMNTVVTAAISGVTDAPGTTNELGITRIHSTSELEATLGIDADASFGCGLFGGVSARFEFARASKIHSSSLFMAVTASVELGFTQIDAPA